VPTTGTATVGGAGKTKAMVFFFRGNGSSKREDGSR
jgi:hypothetical protein